MSNLIFLKLVLQLSCKLQNIFISWYLFVPLIRVGEEKKNRQDCLDRIFFGPKIQSKQIQLLQKLIEFDFAKFYLFYNNPYKFKK